MITDPHFYIVAVPCVLLYGMSKGGLGPALGAVAIPAMSLVIHPITAAGIFLPVLCVMDLFAIWSFKKSFDPYHLKILLPAGIVGIIIASLLMGHLSEDATRMIIGMISVTFCLNYWARPKFRQGKKGGRLSGWVWGVVSGFTSTQIHAGGPPVSVYLLPQNLDRVVLMGTMAVFFAVMNYLKLIPYTILGELDASNIMTSLVLIPLAPVGVKMGNLILNRVSQKTIYRFLYIALFLSGMKLLFDGIF